MTDDDVVCPRIYADEARFHAMLCELRTRFPVRWTSPAGYRPFWAISKYADIAEIEARSDVFLAGPRNRLMLESEELQIKQRTGGAPITRSLPTMDAPDHRKYRGVTQARFAYGSLVNLEPKILGVIDRRLDHAASLEGTFDFVKEVSLGIPLRVIMLILGIEECDGDMLHRLTGQLFSPLDPDAARATDGHATAEAVDEFFAYFRRKISERRATPTEDLLSVIANATIDGSLIDEHTALSYCVSIIAAGHDTTAATIAGGTRALITHPDQLSRLRRGEVEISAAVEEMLRFVSPVRSFMRVANEDYTLRQKTIRAGDAVLLLYPSGNRDEDVFEDADSFRLDRGRNTHMAFGAGPHMCLGQMLARTQLRLYLTRFVERVSALELAGETRWIEGNFLGGPKQMPVKMQVL
ncbi:cytochrome P450 [Paraburkholderia oxyphila]|uniref:cytochrome P450 n=1 Tax=Paraburkholderia oxyphila TaxID=614212 RepID=UPI000482E2B0|nr:cytochrome P450 [Paraburkholderia oxyphila]